MYYDTYYNIFNFDEAHGLTSGADTPVMFFRSYNSTIYNPYGAVGESSNLLAGSSIWYPSTDTQWLAQVGTTTAMRFTNLPGTANYYSQRRSGYTVGYGPIMIKVSNLSTAGSMYFNNISSLQTNDIVTFTALSGAAPIGLSSG